MQELEFFVPKNKNFVRGTQQFSRAHNLKNCFLVLWRFIPLRGVHTIINCFILLENTSASGMPTVSQRSTLPAILCTLIPCPSLAMAPSTWICRECTLKDDGNKQGPCLICQAPHPKHRAVASVPAAAAALPDNDDAKDDNNDNDDNDNDNNDVDLPRDDNKMELSLPGHLVIDIAVASVPAAAAAPLDETMLKTTTTTMMLTAAMTMWICRVTTTRWSCRFLGVL
jgi:hypothetical protein